MSQPILTAALVLRVTDYSESDRIVTLLTETHGKVSALARGAKKSRKRFGAALGLFGCGEATLRERRDLWLLEELHAQRGFLRLGHELGRFSHACYACELCQQLCPPHEPEPQVYALLRSFLERLDSLPLADKPPIPPLRTFELKLLDAVGLGLSLRHCAACGADIVATLRAESSPERGPLTLRLPGMTSVGLPPYIPFDVERGGVHCPATCFGGPTPHDLGLIMSGRSGGLPLAVWQALVDLASREEDSSLQAAAFTSAGASSPIAAASTEAAIPPAILATCRDVLLAVLRHHLGRDLRAVEFISKLNHSLL
ncbi:MAG: DNA repair protein RecO [Myxococcales bacterium]|nr:DNA repair protein RecO [Myxococcales bacterium]